jgi:hypothetical protein
MEGFLYDRWNMEDNKTREMTERWTLRDHRDYAWDYFKVHAQQRMSLFNFFVVFSSLATTCLVATFQEKSRTHMIGIGIGILLVAISLIFWRLDNRVRFLIRHAEEALKWIEATYTLEDCQDKTHILRLLTCEEQLTTKDERPTYSDCFRTTFLAFAVVGSVGAILSAVCLGRDLPCFVSP